MKQTRQIIKKVRSGDKEAFGELMQMYRRMIYKIIYSNNLNIGDFRLDEDDLFQEGCLALYDSIFSFKEDKGVEFSTYAYVVIRSRISSALRNRMRSSGREIYSLDNFSDHDLALCVKEDPLLYHRQQDLKRQLDSFTKSLNDEDRQILLLKEEECSYKEIARRLNINIKKVDNRLCDLRKRLKKHLS